MPWLMVQFRYKINQGSGNNESRLYSNVNNGTEHSTAGSIDAGIGR